MDDIDSPTLPSGLQSGVVELRHSRTMCYAPILLLTTMGLCDTQEPTTQQRSGQVAMGETANLWLALFPLTGQEGGGHDVIVPFAPPGSGQSHRRCTPLADQAPRSSRLELAVRKFLPARA
jgi:hypothetical protein